MKHGRICTICSTEYEYCPNCNKYVGMPRWKFLFCSENCKNIFDIVSNYEQGKLDAETAKRMLDNLDLQSAEPLKAGTKEGIEKINNAVEDVSRFAESLEENTPEVKRESIFKKKKRKHSTDSDMQTGSLS